MTQDETQLLQHYARLGPVEREMLQGFAEFLAARSGSESAPLAEPTPIERPEKESVVAAIKRLSATYHMLDRVKLLNETSSLMTQHVLQGRPAVEVIDELELVFRRYYEQQTSVQE